MTQVSIQLWGLFNLGMNFLYSKVGMLIPTFVGL